MDIPIDVHATRQNVWQGTCNKEGIQQPLEILETKDNPMKLFSLMCTSALLTAAFAADPASLPSASATHFQTISQKAQAAQQEALAIEAMLKSKSPDMAAVAARAEALDKHAGEMAEAAKSLESAGAEAGRIKASVDVLKVLTENKAKQMASADAGERSRFRATAKNIAMRAEQILKNTQKLGS